MKQSIFEIVENKPLTKDVFRMVLSGDTTAITASGQFVNIQLDGFYLRRPISVCDWDDKTLTIVYKVVGKGTEAMSKMAAGVKLDILTGLGNDYSIWDLEAEYEIDPEEFVSLGKATTFNGWKVNGRCMATVCDGKIVWMDQK